MGQRLAEAWRHRRLIRYFGRRFNQKRYIRTWLGPGWLLLRPLLTVVAQVFVFGGIIKVASGGVPYVIAFLVAFSTWQLFAETAYWSTRSLEINRSALRRVYLPRLTLIAGSATPAIIDFLIVTGLLAASLGYFVVTDGTFYLDIRPASAIAIAGVALLLLAGLTIGLVLAVPGARTRDIRFGLRFALNFWYFFTPVIYPLSAVPEKYRLIMELNPITAPIQMMRLGLLGDGEVPLVSLVATFAVFAPLGLLGAWVFVRSEAAALDHV